MLDFVGQTVDEKFELLSVLGAGGFGTVYRARQAGFNRTLALKILSADAAETTARSRFQREAEILCGLNHRNLPIFFGFGIWQGKPYIATEFIDGQPLSSFLEQTKPQLSIDQLVDIFGQICAALSCAHRHGVVHRDVSADNVMLVRQPSSVDSTSTMPSRTPNSNERFLVKLIDFGLAKFDDKGTSQTLTQEGMAVGSVLYMSPEQCAGKSADSRSDIYSTGCLLFHCLAGLPPFISQHSVALMLKHIHEPVPQLKDTDCALKPKARDAFQSVIDRATAISQDQRYSSADELDAEIRKAAALVDEASNPPFQPFAHRPRALRFSQQKTLTLAIVAITFIIAGSVCYYSARSQNHAAAEPRPTSPAMTFRLVEEYLDQGRNREAKELAAELVSADPSPRNYNLHANTCFRTKDPQCVTDMDIWRKISDFQDKDQVSFAIQIYRHFSRPLDAIDVCTRCIHDRDFSYYAIRAEIEHYDLHDDVKALRDLQAGLNCYHREPNKIDALNLFLVYAVFLKDQRRFAEAARAIDDGCMLIRNDPIGTAPAQLHFLSTAAVVSGEMGDHDKFLNLAQRAYFLSDDMHVSPSNEQHRIAVNVYADALLAANKPEQALAVVSGEIKDLQSLAPSVDRDRCMQCFLQQSSSIQDVLTSRRLLHSPVIRPSP